MKATGNTKTIIKKVGDIQDLVGQAKMAYLNDQRPERADKVLKHLDEAFRLCIEVRDMYDPILPQAIDPTA